MVEGRLWGPGGESGVGYRSVVFFFQAEDGIRDLTVTGVQTCALPISSGPTFGSTRTSHVSTSTRGGSEHETSPVAAPMVCARDRAARTNGVVPLAAMPRTKSAGVTRAWSIAAIPAFTSSSAPSLLFTSAG